MSAVVTGLVDALALLVVVAGVLAAAGVALRAGLREGVPVLLDFLLAAGLLRLSAEGAWGDIGVIATIVAIRHLVAVGLRGGGSVPSGGGVPAGRAAARRT